MGLAAAAVLCLALGLGYLPRQTEESTEPVARVNNTLADALPGRSENRGGYIQCGEALITWLSGHLLEQAPPEYYDARFKTWSRATLPIVPERFQLLERTDRGIPSFSATAESFSTLSRFSSVSKALICLSAWCVAREPAGKG